MVGRGQGCEVAIRWLSSLHRETCGDGTVLYLDCWWGTVM